MGMVIEATGTAISPRIPGRRGARRLADDAARRCLEQARRDACALDLIVNVGNYRDRNLAEPALVALVQEDIGANPGHPPVAGRHGTFSFDVGNGACGVLTALHLIGGFLESGSAGLGMVVASDSPPTRRDARRFPYQARGGALLVARDDTRAGFGPFRFATFPEYAELCDGHHSWRPDGHARRARAGDRGRHVLVVEHRPGYLERAVDCAADVAADVLVRAEVRPRDVELLLASHGPGFADALGDRLGVEHARIAHVTSQFERAHTAELPAVVEAAMHSGQWGQARTALFVSAGAGITVGATLYRR